MIMSEQWIYLDGQFVTKENATISVYDHGFYTGMAFLKESAFTMAIFSDARPIWTVCTIPPNPLR